MAAEPVCLWGRCLLWSAVRWTGRGHRRWVGPGSLRRAGCWTFVYHEQQMFQQDFRSQKSKGRRARPASLVPAFSFHPLCALGSTLIGLGLKAKDLKKSSSATYQPRDLRQ